MALSVAVVIPAHDAAAALRETLPATLVAAGDNARVLVVDAGSTDDTAEVARALGAEVVPVDAGTGPAGARNAGVEAASEAQVVLFLDPDCAPTPDAVTVVRAAFGDRPELAALAGAWIEGPSEAGFFTRYARLRHGHGPRGRADAAAFWAGCGAVRRDAFRTVGGFDAERYPEAAIEDLELGLRLKGEGPVRHAPDLKVRRGTPRSLAGLVRADVGRRLVPGARLALERRAFAQVLDPWWVHRLSAALSPFVLAAVAVFPVALVLRWIPTFFLSAAVLGVSALLHRRLLADATRAGGPLFAIGGWLFHQVQLLYAGATVAFVALERWLAARRARRDSADRADRADRTG